MISFDTETFKITRPVIAPKPVCIQWCDREPMHDLDAKLELYSTERIETLLLAGETLYGHNIAYDMLVIMAAEPDLIETVFKAYEADLVQDTLLNQKLIDIATGELAFRKTRGYDLGKVGHRHGVELDKDDPWRLRYGGLYGIPIENWPDDAREYALRDATACWTIATKQNIISAAWEKEWGSPILHQGPARARADLALALARAWGCRTSATKCRQLEQATEREIERMKEILIPTGLVRPNGSKDTKKAKARVEAAFAAQGLEVPMTSDEEDATVSTEKDTMILSKDEILVMYAEYTTANNLMSRVNDLKKGIWLPLQPRYDSLLETGRTSSSKGTRKGKDEPGQIEGIQIQNFPRALSENTKKALFDLGFARIIKDKKGAEKFYTTVGARECLVPREGNVFVLADYSSAELHTLAQCHIDMFGHSRLAEILNNGDDVHLWVGTDTYSHGEFQYSKDLLKRKKENPFSGWRQAAKPIVFGRPGRMGVQRIVITARKSYEVILTEEEAERTIKVYETLVPELPEYFKVITSVMGGRERGLMRQLRSGRWRGGARYCAMANSFFQGLAADGALAAMFCVAMECYSNPKSPLYGFRIVAFVHDEIVLEGPEERAHEAAMRLQHIMEREMDVFTPDCPTPAEPIVTRVWTKGAEQVWSNGQLMPYEMAA